MQAGDREKVGPHGLEVTRLGLGGTTFGNMSSALDEQTGLDVIDAAFNAGVRYFDTAPLYGYGLSETRLGSGLARRSRAKDCSTASSAANRFSIRLGFTRAVMLPARPLVL